MISLLSHFISAGPRFYLPSEPATCCSGGGSSLSPARFSDREGPECCWCFCFDKHLHLRLSHIGCSSHRNELQLPQHARGRDPVPGHLAEQCVPVSSTCPRRCSSTLPRHSYSGNAFLQWILLFSDAPPISAPTAALFTDGSVEPPEQFYLERVKFISKAVTEPTAAETASCDHWEWQLAGFPCCHERPAAAFSETEPVELFSSFSSGARS